MDAKKIRLLAGYSQTAAAALAHVAPLTWRLFEADPNAVGEQKRRACEAALERLREIAKDRSAA